MRSSHDRDHELIAEAMSQDRHAHRLLLVHLAGEHDLECARDASLPF